MKWLGYLLFLTSSQSLAQTFEIAHFTDSLIVQDADITLNPFSFGDEPLIYLKKFNPTIKKELFENNHVDGKIDTIHNLTIGSDKFSVFQATKTDTWLLSAEVKTSKFKTRLGIHVNQTKEEVIQLLKIYNLKSLPNCLVLENIEYSEYLLIRFRKGKVASIGFSGYYD